MGESNRRKLLGTLPREPKIINEEERRQIIRESVIKAIADVNYMWNDMNKPINKHEK
jgi:hypothetical protein